MLKTVQPAVQTVRHLLNSACRLTLTGVTTLAILLAADANARSFPEFTDLVKKVSPAVVNITAVREQRAQRLDGYDERDVPDFLRRFFRDGQPRAPRPSRGSGFIVSADGYILTNHHVVEDAKEISVALGDRRYRVAELVGADPSSDLALLKIEAENLPTVEIGSSEELQVGEWVMAIGSPFGFELSVTAGIVSAKGRSLLDEVGYYVPYIQTDVAINPGNSGGPLLNLEGKVVGINSQIYTRSGGFMGLSFAIPIDVAMEVVEQLKEKGHVSRGWLGVLIQRVDRDLAESFGLDRAQGALITEVLADSPAEHSGLLEGDIILKFDGHKIDLSSDLPHVVGRIRADTVVDAEIVRDGKVKTIDVKVGLLPAPQKRIPGERERRTYGRLGIGVEDLSPEVIERLGVDKGVLVTILGQGPARTAGIEQGDVITTLDGESITSVSQLQQMVQQLPVDEAIPIRVVRNQTPEFLVIKIPE